jgi:hypothetical protein
MGDKGITTGTADGISRGGGRPRLPQLRGPARATAARSPRRAPGIRDRDLQFRPRHAALPVGHPGRHQSPLHGGRGRHRAQREHHRPARLPRPQGGRSQVAQDQRRDPGLCGQHPPADAEKGHHHHHGARHRVRRLRVRPGSYRQPKGGQRGGGAVAGAGAAGGAPTHDGGGGDGAPTHYDHITRASSTPTATPPPARSSTRMLAAPATTGGRPNGCGSSARKSTTCHPRASPRPW